MKIIRQILLIALPMVFPVCTSYSKNTLDTSKWAAIDLQFECEKLQHIEEKSPSGYCLADEEEGLYVYYVPKENSFFALRRLPESENGGFVVQSVKRPLSGKYSEQTEIDYRGWVMLFPEFESIDNVWIAKLINRK